MDKQNNEQPYIGSYVLESLTTGMYGESENAIREYVQNAFDSVRSAVHLRLVSADTARINVVLTGKDQISISDNGVGVAGPAAYKTLTSVGASKKDREKQAGFRGIGRLAGIAFCDRLTFRTKASGEDVESTLEFDCKALRRGMNDGSSKLVDLLQSALTFTQNPSDSHDSHYMDVTLKGLGSAPEVFRDVDQLREYLAETSPVRFDPAFTRSDEVLTLAKQKKWTVETSQVFVGTSELTMKPVYKLYKDAFPLPRGSSQKITRIEDFSSPQGHWWAWVGCTDSTGNVLDKRVHGLRVRVKNIAIDRTTIFDELFSSVKRSFSRFNSYYVGEVHINPSLLIPNARRDGFEDNTTWRKVKQELQEQICRPLAARAYDASTQRQKSIEKIETDLRAIVTSSQRAGKSGDADTKLDALNKGAKLRVRITEALTDALPEAQMKLKAQLQQLQIAQRGLTKGFGDTDCQQMVNEALERVFMILDTYLGPEEYRKVKRAIEASFKK